VSLTLEDPAAHRQFERQITISYLGPRKRRREGYALSPDGLAWYTLSRDGRVDWDSRQVPGFQIYATLEEARAQARVRHNYGPGPENDDAIARWEKMVADLRRAMKHD
jgi:hypothetical protein